MQQFIRKNWHQAVYLGGWSFQAILLLMRLWMANIFFKAGLTKINDWEKTVALFRDEYKVPIIPPEVAAAIATPVELIAPFLLVIGLGTRFAAAAMFIMTLVIEFTYAHFDEHVYWGFMLLTFITYGAGRLSVDSYIYKKYS